MAKKINWLIVGLMMVIACKKPYDPPAVYTDKSYLVVEGLINTGQDSTIITLSRTVNVASAGAVAPELNAQVFIEDSKNNSYPLSDIGNGRYASLPLNLDNMLQYRLRIKTIAGQTYLSDFVTALASPPIDSLGFTIQNNGVQVYANTHDATNNIKYYRWEYGETWMFTAQWAAQYKIVNDRLVYITDGQDFQCWGHDTSSALALASAAHLSQAVINHAPITFLPSSSEKLQSRYSILVKQYGLTSGGYNYYFLLKQNTENLGTLFAPQPSALTGNIHNIANANEPVLGYISAGTVSEKRIYIDSSNLPAWVPITYYYTYGCPQDTLSADQQPPGYVPYFKKVFALYICTDCTLRGTNKEPAFWHY